jgi:hypothetical protein
MRLFLGSRDMQAEKLSKAATVVRSVDSSRYVVRYVIGQAASRLIPEDAPFDTLNSWGTLQDASGAMQLLPLFANIKTFTPQGCDCINQKINFFEAA